MAKILKTKEAHDLIVRAVTALAGEEAAKRLSPSVDAAFALGRQTVIKGSGGKHEPDITSVRVSLRKGSDSDDGETVTTIFKERQPIGSGPTKRTPIRTGGGHCFSVTIGPVKITVCVEWES